MSSVPILVLKLWSLVFPHEIAVIARYLAGEKKHLRSKSQQDKRGHKVIILKAKASELINNIYLHFSAS